jgi:predicted chitinase
METLTIKELVLQIVEEILSSEEALQELFVRRQKSSVPKKRSQYPQKVVRYRHVRKIFANRGGFQDGARYVRRGGPQANPSASGVVRPPQR